MPSDTDRNSSTGANVCCYIAVLIALYVVMGILIAKDRQLFDVINSENSTCQIHSSFTSDDNRYCFVSFFRLLGTQEASVTATTSVVMSTTDVVDIWTQRLDGKCTHPAMAVGNIVTCYSNDFSDAGAVIIIRAVDSYSPITGIVIIMAAMLSAVPVLFVVLALLSILRDYCKNAGRTSVDRTNADYTTISGEV